MRLRFGLALAVLLAAAISESAIEAGTTTDAYGRMPLSFEANQGQVDPDVRFLSRGRGYSLFLTATEVVLSLQDGEETGSTGIRMKLLGANPQPCLAGEDLQPGKSNYFVGSDPSMWRTDIAHFGQVRYEGVYPGVDLIYYGTNQNHLEFDFLVSPGASPEAILFSLEGGEGVHIDPSDGLVMKTKGGEVRLHQPVVYQEIAGERREIAGRYVLVADALVTFELDTYDDREPLIIDPVLSYSTYLGGSDSDSGVGIFVDPTGNAYITGGSWSVDFPTTIPIPHRGESDVFVTKINPSGTGLVYSTYIGGSDRDGGTSVVVDASGNAYVTGTSVSTDYPTVNPFQATGEGIYMDTIVTKLDPNGGIVYSSYLGGSEGDHAHGIAVDDVGAAYVTGDTKSLDFPTVNPLQPTRVGGTALYVAKVHPNGASLIYSTYLGGSGKDLSYGIAVDGSGSAYVTGSTQSTDFPLSSPLQTTPGGEDAFVSKLTPAGDGLLYSTYLGGGSSDWGSDIAVDGAGQAYIVGSTLSADFPLSNPFQATIAGGSDAFVAVIDATGSALVTASYLGGSGDDYGTAIALDAAGDIFVTGFTTSGDFPSVDGFQLALGGDRDAIAVKIDSNSSVLLYSSYLGGSFVDSGWRIAAGADGSAYIVGHTSSVDFPIKSPYQSALLGTTNAFVTKIGPCSNPPVADAGGNATICQGETTTLDAAASTPCASTNLEYRWLDGATVVPGCDWSATTTCDVTPQATTVYTLEVLCLGGDPTCVITNDVRIIVTVEPDLVPPDIGNTVRAIESNLNVSLSWASVANARTYNLYRGTRKDVWPVPFLTDLTSLTETLPDVPSIDSYFYRVTGASCSGMEGP